MQAVIWFPVTCTHTMTHNDGEKKEQREVQLWKI